MRHGKTKTGVSSWINSPCAGELRLPTVRVMPIRLSGSPD